MGKNISRRDFLKGSAAGIASMAAAGVLSACGTKAEAPVVTEVPAPAPEVEEVKAPVLTGDGKYVTRAMGHEDWVNVCTVLRDGAIVSCSVLSHEETIGIGNYACARIPAAIVAAQSINVPNVKGASTTSRAIKAAVKEALETAGYDVDKFSAEVTAPASTEVIEEETDIVIMGAGTVGLTTACRLLEAGYAVTLVEKKDIPGGSMSMTYGGVATAGSDMQTKYDVSGALAAGPYGSVEGMMNFWMMMEQYHRKDFYTGEMPFMTAQYTYSGKVVDWLNGMGVGFNTLGSFEGALSTGATTPYLAPGCYEGGAGYAMMFLANRIAQYENGKIIFSTSVTELIKDEKGKYVGVKAVGDNGAQYTINAKAVVLASGGYARNAEMLAQYNPGMEKYFFNCASASTGDGIKLGLEAGSVVECENRPLPAYLSSHASKFELAFIHSTCPGIMVNVKGDNIGNITSDNHYTMAKAKLNPDNGDTFYYVFDDASAVMLKDNEAYGMNGYKAMFEKGEAVKYLSVDEAASTLNLPGLAAAIENNNKASLAGEPDEFGRKNCPYIDTRAGVWAIRVDPTFYLTTAGLKIDTDCHVLTAEGDKIPGLYAAGDVCGSIEEKDAKQYGMGFDAALSFGYILGETIKNEVK